MNREEAFRFLRGLKRGDAVIMSTGETMYVARELDLQSRRVEHYAVTNPLWEFANVHLVKGPGQGGVSVTVAQQMEQGEIPYILHLEDGLTVKTVVVDQGVYKRIDQLLPPKEASIIKNYLSKKAKVTRADAFV